MLHRDGKAISGQYHRTAVWTEVRDARETSQWNFTPCRASVWENRGLKASYLELESQSGDVGQVRFDQRIQFVLLRPPTILCACVCVALAMEHRWCRWPGAGARSPTCVLGRIWAFPGVWRSPVTKRTSRAPGPCHRQARPVPAAMGKCRPGSAISALRSEGLVQSEVITLHWLESVGEAEALPIRDNLGKEQAKMPILHQNCPGLFWSNPKGQKKVIIRWSLGVQDLPILQSVESCPSTPRERDDAGDGTCAWQERGQWDRQLRESAS